MARAFVNPVQQDRRTQALLWLQSDLIPSLCVCLFSVLMCAQVPELGPLLVLAQFGLFGVLIATRPAQTLHAFLRWWPLLTIPLLAIISAFWSDLPAASARYGLQFFFTCFVGVLLATLVTPTRFVAMSFLGLFVFSILCILSNRQGFAADGMVLVGFTGSKNQMALVGYTLMVAAMATLLDSKNHRFIRLATLPAFPVALWVLVSTSSATAVLIAFAAAPGLVLMHFSQRFTPAARAGILIAAIAVVAPITLAWKEISEFISYFLFDVMDKDPTLTGRTHLWAYAQSLIDRRPILGYGYQSIWVGETSDTLAILRWAGIQDGRQFNFHNTYMQVGVDLGYVGMAILMLTLFIVTFMALRQYIFSPTSATNYFFISLAILLALSLTEVILLPFLPRTLMLFSCAVYAFWRPTSAVSDAPAPKPVRAVVPKSPAFSQRANEP